MSDEPRRSTGPFEVAFLLLALLLAGIHLYLGLAARFVPPPRARAFALIGLLLLVGPALYFTPYWKPVLYPIGTALAVSLGVVWVLSGMEYFYVGVLTGVVATGLVVVSLYLFFNKEFRRSGS